MNTTGYINWSKLNSITSPTFVSIEETNKEKKKGKPMYDCFACVDGREIDEKKFDYVSGRVNCIASQKRDALRLQFNLDETSPKTGQEAIDLIKAGTYQLKDEKEVPYWANWTSYIIWRAPDVKPDNKGFALADKALDDKVNSVRDIINTGDTAAQLAAINDLLAWTYTAPAAS